jgi:hypothetical protein
MRDGNRPLNWTFFDSDNGGKTAAVLRSFVACCQRIGIDPFAWFKDVQPHCQLSD